MSDEDTQTDDVETTEVETPEVPDAGADVERDKAFAEQRRKARAAEKRAKDLEAKLAQKERAEAEAEGKWQEIAKDEQQKREQLEQQVADRDRREAITEAAQRLHFKNPGLAHKLLSTEEIADERAAERALARLVKEEPYLVQGPPSRTGAPAGDGAAPDTEEKDPYARAGLAVLDMIERGRSGGPG